MKAYVCPFSKCGGKVVLQPVILTPINKEYQIDIYWQCVRCGRRCGPPYRPHDPYYAYPDLELGLAPWSDNVPQSKPVTGSAIGLMLTWAVRVVPAIVIAASLFVCLLVPLMTKTVKAAAKTQLMI